MKVDRQAKGVHGCRQRSEHVHASHTPSEARAARRVPFATCADRHPCYPHKCRLRRKLFAVPPILNAQGISKTYGATPLFRGIAFTIAEGDRIGVIGPNGSGKSTLLQILSGAVEPDSGQVALRKRARISLVQQDSQFAAALTVRAVIEAALQRSAVPADERQARFAETLGRAGFEDLEVKAESLSGGWRKRLAIARERWSQPDSCCWTSPRTTSTWTAFSGSRSCCAASPRPSWS